MARRTLPGKRIIVTGASSGIGRALALLLVERGARVVVCARREPQLEQLLEEVKDFAGELHIVTGDITDIDLRQKLLDTAQEKMGGLDILINNAGIGALGFFEDATPERLRQVMEVDFFAPVELIRGALPLLYQGNSPIIVNIGSVLGHRAVPGKSEYCAGKFAMHGFNDALRAELAGEGIDVLLVSPSTTKSEFFDSVIEKKGRQPSESEKGMTPLQVAQKTVRAIELGKQEIILSISGKALVWVDRLCPPLANWMVAKYGKK
ncbi:MAG: glucose dehydrogenase [Blastopirellula sp.]|nr:MAG: glucose dehydrogenase [Blastopirellula sp.]